jgi:hypothetical protein
MLANIPSGHLIGNALVAERAQQPIEDFGGVVSLDRVCDFVHAQIGLDIVDKRQRSRQPADSSDQINGMVKIGRIRRLTVGIEALARSAKSVSVLC